MATTAHDERGCGERNEPHRSRLAGEGRHRNSEKSSAREDQSIPAKLRNALEFRPGHRLIARQEDEDSAVTSTTRHTGRRIPQLHGWPLNEGGRKTIIPKPDPDLPDRDDPDPTDPAYSSIQARLHQHTRMLSYANLLRQRKGNAEIAD